MKAFSICTDDNIEENGQMVLLAHTFLCDKNGNLLMEVSSLKDTLRHMCYRQTYSIRMDGNSCTVRSFNTKC